MTKKRVLIVGGGISGLATAHRLRELDPDCEITLLEASSRWGGVIETENREGFLMESGPDAFISEKPWALKLIQRIGLESELIQTNSENRKSYILKKGKLIPVTEGFYLIAPNSVSALIRTPLISFLGKIRMAFDFWIPRRKTGEDESVASFIRRRLGKEALDRLGQPMVSGIHTADPEHLSLSSTMPQFLEMEQKFGGVIKALIQKRKESVFRNASGPRYSLFLSLRGGMGTLIHRLIERLTGIDHRTNSAVEGLERSADGWKVTLKQGERLFADAVVLATPSYQAAKIVHNLEPQLAEELRAIPYASVATVNVTYRRQDVSHPLDGFGFVVPHVENRQLVACSFSSIKFEGRTPDEDHVLLRAFVGGALQPEVLELPDAQLEKTVHSELSSILGIRVQPRQLSVCRYSHAMPQYHVGHAKRVQRIQKKCEKWEGLYLTGNAYRGVGIPDCIRDAEATAEAVLNSLDAASSGSIEVLSGGGIIKAS